MELERWLEELRQMGLSEQQIVDFVNQLSWQSRRSKSAPAQEDISLVKIPAGDAAQPGPQPDPDQGAVAQSDVAQNEDSSPSDAVQPDQVVTGPEVQRLIRQVVQSSFSGPLPPPAIVRQYEELMPGYLEQEMEMRSRQLGIQEKDAETRSLHVTETLALRAREQELTHVRLTRGQWNALAVVAGMFLLAGYVAQLGHPETAARILQGTVVALAVAFLGDRIVDKLPSKSGKRRELPRSKNELPESRESDSTGG